MASAQKKYLFIYFLKYIYTGCIHISKDAIFKICALSYIQCYTGGGPRVVVSTAAFHAFHEFGARFPVSAV